ncbi:amidohydrolase family protein [Cohnella candidum]|uniref:Amidohydrolase n=1 Tax=Cohnella candidum TaxID=2674991 RepID=A0A3G3JTM6_9BACL|nr:amidohydrolase family protein [Cohnella candidum]AYQ71575.1 amidohydrolase [Cohnella candidum]
MNDTHTHFIPPQAMDWLLDNSMRVNAQFRKQPGKADFLSVNGKWEFELKEAFVNPELYLAEQREAGILHSLVSPIPQLFLYDFAPEITLELSRCYNDGMADWVGNHRDRLSALATLPMNDPESAALELERAMGHGLRGAIVASSWSGKLLSDEAFAPFWETADRLRAIVFVHPLLCEDPRLRQKMLPNLIGVPWETTVCATALLLNGYAERYPGAKILLAHGGGFMPYQIGRLSKGCEQWPAVAASLSESPIDAVKRFWYDSVLWSESSLHHLVRTAGIDRVTQGTDYPFDLCEWPPAKLVRNGFDSLMKV